MISSDSLEGYMSEMVKRYSSLFTLPPQEKIVLYLFVSCVVLGLLTIMPLFPSYGGFALGLMFGVSFFLIAVSSDFVISRIFMKKDPIFNSRRCSALSLFSSLIWLGLVFLGCIISIFLESLDVWIRFFLLGYCAVLMLRLVVFSTVSFAHTGRVFLASVLHPTLYVILALLMAPLIGFNPTASLITFIPFSILVVGSTVLLFSFLINIIGKEAVGIPSLSLFKAFMASWTEDSNAPLESFFERIGSRRDVEVSWLAFTGSKEVKAMIVVPAFHPGPFRNVGSSLFPSMLQDALENKLQCIVSVPHGLVGHGLDLCSQVQSQKVIDSVLDSVDFSFLESRATPFVRVKKKGASTSCQMLGDCAFLTLTLAPETMEDLPEELNSAIVNEAEGQGLSSTIVVDAHNSINGPFNLETAMNPLKMAAVASLEETLSCQRCPFQVGASRIVPKEFGVEDGMGPGGISVIVTEVDGQKAAYVTIDGNNMISGLRGKILSMLWELGITEGEVLTTDTHAVNGVVLTPRGYHPIGEAMDQSKLVEYVRETAIEALKNLEPAKVSWHTETVPDIKVIGEEQIEALCTLTGRAARRAKRLAATLLPIAVVFLIIFLAFV
jgi:putative membrane protein